MEERRDEEGREGMGEMCRRGGKKKKIWRRNEGRDEVKRTRKGKENMR